MLGPPPRVAGERFLPDLGARGGHGRPAPAAGSDSQVPSMSPAAGRSPAISACRGGLTLAEASKLVFGGGDEQVAHRLEQ